MENINKEKIYPISEKVKKGAYISSWEEYQKVFFF